MSWIESHQSLRDHPKTRWVYDGHEKAPAPFPRPGAWPTYHGGAPVDDTTSPESEEPVVYGLFEINCRDTNGEQVRFVVDFKTAARLADDLAMWTDER